MKIAVKDANILIDLELMGILDLWFQLGIETLTTSLVVAELHRGGHEIALGYIESGAIESVALDPFELAMKVADYDGSGLSESDVSVLLVAEQRRAILLSGDGKLRQEAEAEQVEVHGTIWILDQLIDNNVLCPVLSASKLEYLLSRTGGERRYLPKKICKLRISRWREL